MIQVDLQNVRSFIPLPYEAALSPRLRIAHDHLQNGDGAGGEFTGWVRLPEDYDKAEFARIKAAAKKIQSDSQALVVIGIGGSYLGARGVIECLRSPNYNLKKKNTPNIYFIGNGLSSDALTEVMELVDGVDFSVNVISKSGTTTEPAVAFRFFRELLEKKYGAEGAAKRIYATTDARKGALKGLADDKGYEEFVVPDNIGGRYSVLTAVGLLPIAVAGIDIDALMAGAADMMRECAVADMNAKCRRVEDLGLVVIDYLQLMNSAKRIDNRVQEISEITRSLKIMAKELNIPVVTLAQLARAGEKRQEHRPVLSDLRDSGSIEQDADCVLFLYRDSYYASQNPDGAEVDADTAECIVAKNRHGETSTVPLGWDGAHTRFMDVDFKR